MGLMQWAQLASTSSPYPSVVSMIIALLFTIIAQLVAPHPILLIFGEN